MNAALQTSGTVLTFVPGTGIVLDSSGDFNIDLAALAGGVGFSVTAATAEGTPYARYRVTVVEEPLADEAPAVVSRFEAPGELGAVTFLGAGPVDWTQHEGFARLTGSPSARVHGDWSGAGGDGLYRCLFRVRGGLPAAIDRRFSFGARIRLEADNWHGVRVELFETTGGDRRIHIREYAGALGTTQSLATTPASWDYDAWTWLEVEVAGATVRGRVYPEGAAAPAWQVEASTTQLDGGAFGPGAFPAAKLAPVIDIRQLEYSRG